MKKEWLRGLLLGVSLASLLSGGVALAAPRISIDPWCGVCCEYAGPVFGPDQDLIDTCEPYWSITSTDWGIDEAVLMTLTPPGTRAAWEDVPGFADDTGTVQMYLHLPCWREEFDFGGPGVSQWWVYWAEDWQADDYGKWSLLLEGASGAVEADFYFVEGPSDCQVEEFVPEPGSILLLGSGLVGLAGYATLRWRTRE